MTLKELWLKRLRTEPEKNHLQREYKREHRFCAIGLLVDEYCKFHEVKNLGSSMIIKAYWELPMPEGLGGQVIELNDSGATFAEIADYVESAI